MSSFEVLLYAWISKYFSFHSIFREFLQLPLSWFWILLGKIKHVKQCLYFAYYLLKYFIYLKGRVREREGETEWRSESFTGWGWARPKPGAKTSSKISHVDEKGSSTWTTHFPLPSQQLTWGAGVTGWSLTCCAAILASCFLFLKFTLDENVSKFWVLTMQLFCF